MVYLQILRRSMLATTDDDLFPKQSPQVRLPRSDKYTAASTSSAHSSSEPNAMSNISVTEDMSTKPIYPEPDRRPLRPCLTKPVPAAPIILSNRRYKQYTKPAAPQKPSSKLRVVLPGRHNYPYLLGWDFEPEMRKVSKHWRIQNFLSGLPVDVAHYDKITESDPAIIERDAINNMDVKEIEALDALDRMKLEQTNKRAEMHAWSTAKW